ncbi:MAG: hypothetical protein J6E38_03335 [Clostridia bacterium]|nr:hypothetical protein [Clostridia bacterium]
MLELRTLADILKAQTKAERCSCRSFIKEVKTALSETHKKLAEEKDFVCRPEREEAARWMYENFPRLEETAKNDISVLKRLPRLAAKGKELLFCRAFSYILDKNKSLCRDEITEIFKTCNECGTGVSLQDTESLIPLFRLSLTLKICKSFLGNNSDTARNAAGEIRDLFVTLDELSFVDAERIFESNGVEKILRSDPFCLYSRLTGETKAMYRKNLLKLAKTRHISQTFLAEAIVEKCKNNKGNDRHIGKYLCDKACGGQVYLFLILFMTFLFTLLLCLISPVFVVCVFSVYGCSRLIADKFYVRFFVKNFRLPCTALEKIPAGHGVMTVITSLLTGGESDGELFSRLETMYHSNGGENVYFGLLCDLCDSHEKNDGKDKEIIDSAAEKVLELRKKYGNRFFFFVRERKYSESEEMYIAPERKRGAVNALCGFLCGKGDSFGFGSIKPDEKICRNIRYIFTLDSDTNLSFDCLKTMVGIMMHPQNAPVVDNEKCAVVSGYGILQPAMNSTLESAGKSFFSSVMCGHGGVDLYTSGGSDTVMSMFGRSIFCGKGMFDKECFYSTLCDGKAFEEERILSHDAPEGARLRCAYVPDVILTDSFPAEELAFYKRQHRWIRGDVQNIPFLFGHVKTCDGGRIKNGIGYASKFFIWQNVYSAILPVFTLITLFISVFCDENVSSILQGASLAVYLLPFGYSVLSGAKRKIWHNFRRVFYSDRIYTGIWTSFFVMLFRLSSIPKSAAVSIDAVARSTYRSLVSHKGLLEWTTAAQNDAEKRDGLLGYIKKNLVSAVCGALLFTLSDTGILKLLSLLWLFMPVFAYHAGKRKNSAVKHLSEKEKKKLLDYCGDMWRFFSDNVGEETNYIPPDNVADYPERKVSRMTSPTNIGLYLVSALCALKMGFADEKEVISRLAKSLESVDGLEKYMGLLYNWYDVFKKQPMEPKYVSSVDLGNYIACLICVKEGVKELCGDSPDVDKVVCLCEKLISETDLSLLFDNSSKLFYIGGAVRDGNFAPDRNRYDMLMSEARTLSLCAVAKRLVPSEHMRRLSRRFVEGRGYMGLASWSGTAFEFFMPEIFMPSKSGSLVYEALCFAYSQMRKKGAGRGKNYVFGISESCYNEFDRASNYKYHAFGVPEIAVNVFEKQKVISPYSSFLFMKMSKKEVMSNLERLEKLGAYGEYGFYESVDFERPSADKDYSVVKCFMSHHVGMSIAALTNLVCEGAVAKWFLKDRFMKSAMELTEERIPYDTYVTKRARRHYIGTFMPCDAKGRLSETNHAKLESEGISIIAKKGKLDVKKDNLLLARKNCFSGSLSSFEAAMVIDGKKICFDKKCSLLSDGGQLVMTKTVSLSGGEKFEAALSVTVGNNTSSTVRFRMRLRQLSGQQDKRVSFSLSFFPLLDTKENSLVCSFFDSSDFVTDFKNNATELYFRRLSKKICMCAGCVDGKNKEAFACGEKSVLLCDAVKGEGLMYGEFAISVSGSTKCAETGLVRCREDSFSVLSEKLRCSNLKKSANSGFDSASKRLTGVLGCSTDKENIRLQFPINSKEKPFYLMSTPAFSALAEEKSLGVCFEKDIEKGRVSYFSGTAAFETDGEKLLLDDGFDLCKNCTHASLSGNMALYEGRYKDKNYKVSVFVSSDKPCKIMVAEGLGGEYINYGILPSAICDGERHIGGGLVFFGIKDDKDTGFAFGVCESGEGANYILDDKVNVKLYCKEDDERCIFCIGKSSRDQAGEIFTAVRNGIHPAVCKAKAFTESIFMDMSLADKELIKMLEKYFVFPEEGICMRAFVKTGKELCLFDTLVLMYTHYQGKRDMLIKAFDMSFDSHFNEAMSCILLSEYVRVTGDMSVTELKIKGETLYKRCLSYSLGISDTMNESIYVSALGKMSYLCGSTGDLRTAINLDERIKKITRSTEDGIFL